MANTLGDRPHRRSFLRAIGAGAAAIGVSGALSGTGAAQDEETDDEPAGYLSIIYDDGPAEDYDMYRIHREYDAPGCTAACSGLVDSDESWLTTEQLEEMSDFGWEVMSHTVDHRPLGKVSIEADVEADDDRIYAQTNNQGRFEGDPIVVLDGESKAKATVVGNGEDDTGLYIELEEPIGQRFDATEAFVRYTDEFIEEILANSRAQLEEIVGEGWITGFIYPYERNDGFVSEAISNHYDAAPRRDKAGGLNPESSIDPHALSREYMETDRMDEDEIERFLDTVANEPDYGILAGHSQYDTLPPERLEFVLEQAQQRDIQVVTVQDALDAFGVVDAPERNIEDETPDDATTDEDNEDGGRATGGDESSEEDEPDGFFARIFAFFRSLFN
ncbi:polysaccharide deacetylase family protein [Halalkalicoccus subterraneus]|uniref:polysaccharide deacetylase family protein n=1 Tax=Halalkalicoccus subterraneus TaxID=2675002 RepID=UPI001FE74295|nr:polysaccharide deacetylase family protein [Halalkalicoccus subterraneus]